MTKSYGSTPHAANAAGNIKAPKARQEVAPPVRAGLSVRIKSRAPKGRHNKAELNVSPLRGSTPKNRLFPRPDGRGYFLSPLRGSNQIPVAVVRLDSNSCR